MSLENLLSAVGLLVLEVKGRVADEDQKDIEQAAGNAGVHARLVSSLCILGAEDERAGNATNATEADKSSAAESTLPLAADVVGLEGHDGGHVGVGARSDKEDTKVADGRVRVPAHDGQANQAEKHVEEDDGAANAVLVSKVAADEHDDAGECVWRGNEALSLVDREAKVAAENEGQGVCQGVGDGGGVEEDHGVGPDLPVGAALEEAGEVELGDDGVATVTLDAVDDPLALALPKEAPSLALGVGEVYEEPVGGNAEDAGDEALDEEDPAPACETSLAVELHEAVGEDTGEG